VKLVDFPVKASPGDSLNILVNIRNLSTTTWPAHIRKAVKCSYHIYDCNGKILLWDGARSNLPYDMSPNSEIALPLTIEAPSEPGQYRIAIDLVQEQVTSFSNKDVTMPSFESPLATNNTRLGLGDRNNILNKDSVAVSPDLNAIFPFGSRVVINGKFLGFRHDTITAKWHNTVAVYDPDGQWKEDFDAYIDASARKK
jgi:3D (Asp-Asp-Asp) domain-containing protein